MRSMKRREFLAAAALAPALAHLRTAAQDSDEAGFVTGHLELGADGKALKYFEVVPFSTAIDLAIVVAAVEGPRGRRAGPENPRKSKGTT